jgi:hypothetical protein
MSITINQQPLGYTPSNAQHIYNAGSTLSGSTNFRYVFDVWMEPYTNPERIARVKVAPNTSGVGIVDVGDIVKNYVKPNTRTPLRQIKDQVGGISTFSNPNGQIPFSSGGYIPSNGFNDNPNYPSLPHVSEYRVLIGEEYVSGNTTILDICLSPTFSESEWDYSLETAFTPYGGTPNRVNITDASINSPDYGPTSLLGWSYIHQNTSEVLISSGTTTASTGNYTAMDQPSTGDILKITENGTGCYFLFQWGRTLPEEEGWNFITSFCPECQNNPPVITIWPGVQQNKKIWNYDNSWWGNNNTDGENNHLWYDLYKYKFKPYNQLDTDEPGHFLTTFGTETYTNNFIDASSNEFTLNTRVRSHHYQCPILLSFFYRDFQNILPGTRQPGYLKNQQGIFNWIGSSTMDIIPTNDLTDNRIVYRISTIGQVYTDDEIGFFLSTGTTTTAASLNTNRISEGVVYKTYGDECMSDPQHFLFLNQQGVFDVWTFDRKNIKSYTKENSVYAQGIIRDNSIYNPLFNSQRNVIYDQTITEIVEAQSHFMEENDRTIVEELFLSTHVYLMKDFYWDNNGAAEYSLTPHLIPISITSNSIQEYKQRYNKVFQYTLTYEYNPIQQHRSNL